MSLTKRQFLQMTTASVALCPFASHLAMGQSARGDTTSLHEADFYESLSERRVRCLLCPKKCVVADSDRGACGVRENRNGKYYTLVHSNPCALNNDPIEKKPLFHYKPGTSVFSLATAGCNLGCRFCQNWEISQFRPEQVPSKKYVPDDIVKEAIKLRSDSIAFTYSEPIIFYEYMSDICRAAQGTGIGRVMISNGYILPTPMKKLLPLLDAVKIDFKSFSESFYKNICLAHLKPVLTTLKTIRDAGVWLELVVLVIPTLNDSHRELDAMTRWVVQQLGRDVPIHFTRFHPMYKLINLPPTPVATLESARKIAMDNGIRFAYAGNVPGHPSENTYCPYCQNLLIKRQGYHVLFNRITKSHCNQCGKRIGGRW